MHVPDGYPVRRRRSLLRAGVLGAAGAVAVSGSAVAWAGAPNPRLAALTAQAAGVQAGVALDSTSDCVAYWLQIGAFRDGANATRLVLAASKALPPDGGPALLIVEVDVGGSPLYRVLSGPHDAAGAEARRAAFAAAAIPVSLSTSTVRGCPAPSTPTPTTAAAPTVTAPAPPTPVISAEPPPAMAAGLQVQAGSFRSLEYAQRRVAELNAALGSAVVAGEFAVVTAEYAGAPLYRVRSRSHARAEADGLLVLVRAVVPEAAIVSV
ncbi:MAG: SPOR domain-containing protein [Acidimicrobiales bacterium]|nr:SPOR domain-containing protein [Acidimicrobiales bacterium]